VGCLLPEAMYDPEFENLTVGSVFGKRSHEMGGASKLARALEAGGVPTVFFDGLSEKWRYRDLLVGLQQIHDVEEVEDWAVALDELEKEFFGEESRDVV